ncbi:neuronal acetylcholine receptor subunit alpha-6-like [Mercenaria mercenaria]|uniref:neuronal acetylcholine receptor subunit alpha-6-like n=1 Tax=Mercenaria mercenaria TaxID=6596 RepID=UPI00234F2F8C|nr:neuronal acetylcholine receptor subunit alpha-6-like [Mercenaria mercenaria]
MLQLQNTNLSNFFTLQVFESTCDVDITYFSFDSQECELKFIAWSYSKAEVELNKGARGVILVEYSPNAVWNIDSTSALERNTGESSVTFTIKLKRKPGFYVINIIIPVILLSVLNILTGERVSYAVTVFLSLAVFLTIVSEELPTNSDVISILSLYLTAMITLSTVIVLICILELRLATRTVEEYPINKLFMTVYKVSLFLQCRKRKDQIKPAKMSETNSKKKLKKEDEFNPDRKKFQETWMKIVSAMGYLLFWIFLLLTFILTLVLFLICANN